MGDINLNSKKHIHFIGIGGSGMFPLVEILSDKGFFITGSDNNESNIVRSERERGIKVYMTQDEKNIEGADLIVYSAAIMDDNKELKAALKSNVPTIKRSRLLGEISSNYKNGVCIAGTHGKTTTSSMLTQILIDGDKDPSAVIGGKLKSINRYGVCGKSDIFVCEACEFNDTFLELSPYISIILNIDNDHLDYFKTMDNLKNSFYKFLNLTKDTIIYNGDDENTKEVVGKIKDKNKISFGFKEDNDYYPTNIENIDGLKGKYTLNKQGKELGEIELFVPGKHNILNSLAAIAASDLLGVSYEKIKIGLKNFKGSGRRFEYIGKINGVTVVDDYAHHPTEIEATLKAAKELNFKRVWVLFQPFTYSRTKALLNEFAQTLSIADKVVLTEIMGSREKNIYNIKSEDLKGLIDGAVVVKTLDDAADYILKNAQNGDLVLTLGCGDVYKAAYIMVNGEY